MDLEQLEELIEEADNYAARWGDTEIRESYSGRGMFGASVPAVVASEDIRPQLFYAAGVLGIDFNDVPCRIDNMGLGVVIY